MDESEKECQHPPVAVLGAPEVFDGDIDDGQRDATFDEACGQLQNPECCEEKSDGVCNRERRDDRDASLRRSWSSGDWTPTK